MKGDDIKIWLIQNKTTQKQLAESFGLTRRTLSTYCNGIAPKWFKFALNGLKKND